MSICCDRVQHGTCNGSVSPDRQEPDSGDSCKIVSPYQETQVGKQFNPCDGMVTQFDSYLIQQWKCSDCLCEKYESNMKVP